MKNKKLKNSIMKTRPQSFFKLIAFNLFILLGAGVLNAQNMLLNGDLENWEDSTTPSSWAKAENIIQEATIVHGGTYSAKHVGGTSDLAQTITVVGDKTYIISVWYYVESGDGTDARIWSYWRTDGTNILDNADELRGPNDSYFASDALWQKYEVTVTAPTAANELYFELRTYSSAIAYWDDLSVAEVSNTPVASDLFISEYVEGITNGDNRVIEIFNGTGVEVDLSAYTVKQSHNGTGWGVDGIAYVLPLTGMLGDGDVYVIANTSADTTVLAAADLTFAYSDDQGHKIPFFTGDDALGLFKTETLIDVIGVPEDDPGTGWDVAGITEATANHTLIRKNTVTQGNTDWAASAGTDETDSEWVVYDNATADYIENIGKHTFGEVADETAPELSSNIEDEQTEVAIDTKIIITFDEAIRNIDDSEITDANVAALLTLKETDAAGADVAFTATIDATKEVITVTPVENLKTSQLYYAAMVPVEDAFDNATSEESMTFTTNTYFIVTFNVDMSLVEGFNPSSDIVYFTGDFVGWAIPGSNSEYAMTDTDENMVYSIDLDVPAGDIAYKFFLNAGWDGGEWDGDPNRTATISADTTLNHIFGEVTGETVPIIDVFPYLEDFEKYNNYDIINRDGWKCLSSIGERLWLARFYNENTYAQANSYSSGEENVTYLISPIIVLNEKDNYKISFDVNIGYWTHDGLSVFLTNDFSSEELNESLWTDITSSFNIPSEPANSYGNFQNAGKYELPISNDTIRIIFKYTGDANANLTTTYQIDNFSINHGAPMALGFDGVDDFAVLDNFDYPTEELTIEAWIKPFQFGEIQEIISGFNPVDSSAIQFRLGANGSLLYGENPDWNYVYTNDPIVLNEWNHVAMVRDADGLCKLYINGNIIAENNVKQQISPTMLFLGSRFYQDRFFNGLIDEVRIWSIARTESEIQTNMKKYFFGDEPGLLAYWYMDNSSNTFVTDITNHGYNFQLGSSLDPDINDPQIIPEVWPYRLPLDAKFSSDMTSGTEPLTVQFFDQSTGETAPVSWSWDFNGDGNMDSQDQYPSWTFYDSGIYTVTLTVGDEAGNFNTETKFDFITVLNKFEVEAPSNFDVDRNGFATWELPGEMRLKDDFESYIAGGYLAAQSDNWRTWADDPNMDALISEDQALSGTKSIKFEGEGTSDIILDFDNLNEGHFELKLNIYVVGGNGAYFNMLHSFTNTSAEYAFDVLFEADGTANMKANAISTPFNYNLDAWNECKIDIDLDADWAIFYINGNQIVEWQWSKTANGGDGVNRIGALDFYSHASSGTNPLFYIDDFDGKFLSELSGYNLYLDGNNVGSTTDTSWQYTELNPGVTYQAGVSAVYGDAQYESHIVEQTFETVAEYNVGILALRSPALPYPSRSLCGATNDEEISIYIFNNGLNPVSEFELEYSIDESSPVVETYAGTLNPGDTIFYVFATNADLFTNDYKRVYVFNANINIEDDKVEDNSFSWNINVFGDYADMPGWTTYNSCDGMLSDISFAIAEDKHGNIWSTDFYGASKFDGTNWTTYTTEDGLGENYSWAMISDRDGNIWFSGSSGNVLTKYDGTSFINYTVDGTFEECIYEDTQGNIWFGSYQGSGIARYDGSNWIYYPHNVGISGQQVLSIGEDVYGNIYASTNSGLNIFDGSNWTSFSFPDNDQVFISEIYFDKMGNTWFTTYGNGFFKFDGVNWTHYSVDEGALGSCEDITEDIYGNMWFGGRNEIVKFDGVRWVRYSVENGLAAASAGNIYAIYADSKGDIWTGTYRGGISKLEQTTAQTVDWTVIPNSFAYDGEITGEVFLDDQVTGYGVLGAFVNEECRGVMYEPIMNPLGKLVYTIRIYSNESSGEEISFKFFYPDYNGASQDPDKLPIFDIQERISFESDMIVGDAFNPTPMHAYTIMEFHRSMTDGWNWMSVYLMNEHMQLDSIFASLNPQAGDYIKDRKGTGNSAQFYDMPGTFTGWTGTLNEIDPKETYKMNLNNAGEFKYYGYPIDYENEDIPVNSGWNWIGYPIPFDMPVGDYLASLDIVDGDYLKNQFVSTTYYDVYGWFGQLEMMQPGDGYVLKVANAGSIYNPDSVFKATTVSTKKQREIFIPKYKVNPHNFEFSGSAIVEVFIDEINAGAEHNILYAFNKDNECVGIINGMLYPMTNKYLYNLMLYSNLEEGDELHFKFFEKEENRWYSFEEKLEFNSDMIVADVFQPFELKNAIADDIEFEGTEIYPNPFTNQLRIDFTLNKTQNVRIAVYDSYGKMMELIADKTGYSSGSYKIDWNTEYLPVGIYYIRIEKQEGVENIKVIKMK